MIAKTKKLLPRIINRFKIIKERNKTNRQFKDYLKLQRFPFVAVRTNSTYLVSTRDHHTGFNLFNGKNVDFEDKVLNMYQWCKDRGICKSGNTLVNVGANIGAAVIPLAKTGDFEKVIAFEPDKLNFKLLQANFIFNEIDGELYDVAVSNEDSVKELYLSKHNLGAHIVLDKQAEQFYGRDISNQLNYSSKISCVSLDKHLERHSIEPEEIGLLFVDIEGHEGHLLEGAKKLLGKIPIVTEFCPPFLKRSGGLDMFIENVLQNYKKMVVGVFKKHPSDYQIVDTDEIHKMVSTENIYDLLLIP